MVVYSCTKLDNSSQFVLISLELIIVLYAGGKNLYASLWPDVLNIGPSLTWSSNTLFLSFFFFSPFL